LLEDAYRQAVKAMRELKQVNDRTRYQRPTPLSNNNRNNARPPNNNYTGNNRNNVRPPNNNYTGNNRNNRRSVPPSQNRPNTPRRQPMLCNYCKKPGHFVRDCYRFKARVDAGIIVSYASGQSGNQLTPSRARSEPRRSNATNGPRVQGATKRQRPSAANGTRATTP
jgi:hypothetical protein